MRAAPLFRPALSRGVLPERDSPSRRLGAPPSPLSSPCPAPPERESGCPGGWRSSALPPYLPGLAALRWSYLSLLCQLVSSCGSSLDSYLLHSFESRSLQPLSA